EAVNIAEFGAADNTDSTAAFEAAIAASLSPTRVAPAVITGPPGRYKISRTLTVENAKGLILQGTGASNGIGFSLVWTGNNTTPLLRMFGVRETVVRDL